MSLSVRMGPAQGSKTWGGNQVTHAADDETLFRVNTGKKNYVISERQRPLSDQTQICKKKIIGFKDH